MKAARVENGKVDIKEVPVPEPGERQALVRISTAGVCHSDLHLARGRLARRATPGHRSRGDRRGRGARLRSRCLRRHR